MLSDPGPPLSPDPTAESATATLPEPTPHHVGATRRGKPTHEPAPRPHVRRMGLQDLPFVVALHYDNFPDSFFARLGKRFLTRYYRTFLDGPLAVAILSEDPAGRAGYLVGILSRAQHRQLLLKHHGVALAGVAITALLLRPRLTCEFLRTRLARYVRGLRGAREAQNSPTRSASSGDLAVLSFIVVAEDFRCQGHGTALVEEFLRLAADANCTHACLVTDASNANAQTFYEKRDWQSARTEHVSTAPHRRYQRSVPSSPRENETGPETRPKTGPETGPKTGPQMNVDSFPEDRRGASERA